MLWMLHATLKHFIDPGIRNPVSEQVCHGSNKNVLPHLQLIERIEAVSVHCWLKSERINDLFSVFPDEWIVQHIPSFIFPVFVHPRYVQLYIPRKSKAHSSCIAILASMPTPRDNIQCMVTPLYFRPIHPYSSLLNNQSPYPLST